MVSTRPTIIIENTAQLQSAMKNGDIHSLKQWHAEQPFSFITGPPKSRSFVLEPVILAGQLEVFKWICAQLEDSNGWKRYATLSTADAYFLQLAAESGHLDIIKWMVADSGYRFDASAANCAPLRWAANSGHADVVKWFFQEWSTAAQKNPAWNKLPIPVIDASVNNNDLCRVLAKSAHFELLRWVLLCSGQHLRIQAQSAEWFSVLPAAQQSRIALTCFGIDVDAQPIEQRVARIQLARIVPCLWTVAEILEATDRTLPFAQQKAFFCSEAIQRAVEVGLATTYPDLCRLLQNATPRITAAATRL